MGEGDDDVGDGGGVNSASILIARRSGSFLTASFAMCAVAILHPLGCGGADADTGAGAGVGAVVGSGGIVFIGGVVVGIGEIFDSGSSPVHGRSVNRLHWVGPIGDSTVKPLLWWPGEGTKRLGRTRSLVRAAGLGGRGGEGKDGGGGCRSGVSRHQPEGYSVMLCGLII